MSKSKTVLYKCSMRPLRTSQAVGSNKVQEVIDLVTDMGLLIRHKDGCYTINSKPKRDAEDLRGVKSGVRSHKSGTEDKIETNYAKDKKKRKSSRKLLRPWTLASRRLRSRNRRAQRRGPRKSRSLTRSGARRRQRKTLPKKLKSRGVHKTKTLKQFYSVMRQLKDSMTHLSKRIRNIM